MKKLLSIIGVLVVAGAASFGVLHQQEIKDRYVAYRAELSPEVQAVRDNLELTAEGDLLYRASQPEILAAEAFNSACHKVSKELTIVLGCYTQQRFYVYDVDDSRLDGIKEVTAAHELLHAAYERLSEKERSTLGLLLEKTAAAINDERFQETLAIYQRAEPAHIRNELHSILGTEIAVLPKELEDHYARYFKNRHKITAYAADYESTFTELEQQISQYDKDLATYEAQKKRLENTLAAQQEELNTMRQDMSQRREAGDLEEYNAQVPQFNQKVQVYNQNIASLQSVIKSYNEVVEERNQLAFAQRELLQHMDSTYKPME